MFEDQQAVVDSLLDANRDFRYLYERHARLKDRVRQAETGEVRVSADRLGELKKEKLLCKDKLAAMLREHQASAVE